MWVGFKILLVILNTLTLPLSIVILLLLLIYKGVVILVAKLFKDFAAPIPGSSCVFFPDKIWSNPNCSIVSCMELEGDVTKASVTETLQKIYDMQTEENPPSGVKCYPELGYEPVPFLGFGFWKQCPDFNVSDQIHELSQDFPSKDAPLPQIIETLIRQPFKRGEPIWNITLIHNYNGKPLRTLLICRFHHVLADGLSMIKFIYAGFGYRKLPHNYTKPATAMKNWNALSISYFFKIWTALNLSTFGFVEYLDEILIDKDRNRLNYTSEGKLQMSGKWMCAFGKRLDIAEMKKATSFYGCSITHIFLAGITGALEKYFNKYHSEEGLPSDVHFVNPLPVPNHPDLRLVNYWAVCRVKSELNLTDTAERMKKLKAETKRAALSPLPLISAFMFQFVTGILPTKVIDMITKSKASCTVVMSNVVGPVQTESFGGGTVMDLFFWMPIVQESIAVSAGLISYNGGAHICLIGDLGCVPDRSRLEDLSLMISDEIDGICKPFL